MTTGAIEKLIEDMEQSGYRTDTGQLLTNDRGWHSLRRILKDHPAWPGSDVEPAFASNEMLSRGPKP